ncbi:hypothetical protein AAVH_07517 [Aphelenchoides avenae]|nr:hypothetical protein AAVH_07517 [Aphelenchus avenae]
MADDHDDEECYRWLIPFLVCLVYTVVVLVLMIVYIVIYRRHVRETFRRKRHAEPVTEATEDVTIHPSTTEEAASSAVATTITEQNDLAKHEKKGASGKSKKHASKKGRSNKDSSKKGSSKKDSSKKGSSKKNSSKKKKKGRKQHVEHTTSI